MARIRLLGEPEILVREGGRRVPLGADQRSQLLALLLLHQGEYVTRELILERLWEEALLEEIADDESGWGGKTNEEMAHERLRPVLTNVRNLLKGLGVDGLELNLGGRPKLVVPDGVEVDFLRAEAAFDALPTSEDEGERWQLAREVIDPLAEQMLQHSRNVTPFLNDLREKHSDMRYQSQLMAIALAQGSDDRERREAAKRDAEAAIERWPEEEAPRAGLVRLHLRDGALEHAELALEKLEQRLDGNAGAAAALRGEVEQRRWRHHNGPLPLMLSLTEAEEKSPFVGQEETLQELEANLERVIAGGYCGVALKGEKGVGKSRLARELGRLAHRRGCAVLAASALQPISRQDYPCAPFVDAASAWINRFGTDGMTGLRPTDVSEIARYVPELIEAEAAEPHGERSPEPLQGALRRLLAAIGRLAPTLVVLDDAQAADEQTIHLLRELQITKPGGLMVVATIPAEAAHRQPLPTLGVVQLPPEEAEKLAAAVRGNRAASGGKPSFPFGARPFVIVNQTALDLIEEDFVQPQISAAGAEGHRALRLAALLGSPFELSILVDAAGKPAEDVVLLAEKSGLVRRKSGGSFEFDHSLIRDALLKRLTSIERGQLARLLVDVLDPTPATAATRLRLLKEVTDGDVNAAAAAAALEAAEHAAALTNYEAARTRCEEGLELAGEDDVAMRGSLLVRLGLGLWSLGEFGEARGRFTEAQALTGLRPEVRAEAALGFGGRLGFAGARTDREYIAMLRNALSELPAVHADLRLRLRGALAGALTFGALNAAEKEERELLCASVLAEAEAHEDPTLAAEVMSDVCWTTWNPDRPQERRDLADTFVTRAKESRDLSLRIEARIFRLASSLEDGHMDAVDRDLGRCRELAEAADQPHFKALVELLDGMRDLFDGNPQATGERALEALKLGGSEQNPAVFELCAAQLLMVRLFQGRLDGLRCASEAMADAFPRLSGLRAGLGIVYSELGRKEDAARQLEALAHDRFADVPRDVFWLVTMEHAARLAVALEDRERCRQLYAELAPFAGRVAVAGAAVAVYGAVDRALGLLTGALGDEKGAVAHLRDAVRINERIGARTINAFAMLELAEALERGGGETEEIERLRAESARIAAGHGVATAPLGEARAFSRPSAPPGRLGGLKQRASQGFSHWLGRKIEGRSDEWIERWQFGSRILRRIMPTAFVPEAACGWTGEIQLKFEPPIGFRRPNPFWTFEIEPDHARIMPRRATEPKLSLAMSPATFFKLLAGTVNPVEAWLDGRASIELGDPSVAARLIEMFSGPTPNLDADEVLR